MASRNYKSIYKTPSIISLITILLVQLSVSPIHAHMFQPLSGDDYDKFEQKRSHELASWILSQLNQGGEYGSDGFNGNPGTSINNANNLGPDLCRPLPPSSILAKRNSEINNYYNRLFKEIEKPSKRNSELINSLLRLPKTIDSGRK